MRWGSGKLSTSLFFWRWWHSSIIGSNENNFTIHPKNILFVVVIVVGILSNTEWSVQKKSVLERHPKDGESLVFSILQSFIVYFNLSQSMGKDYIISQLTFYSTTTTRCEGEGKSQNNKLKVRRERSAPSTGWMEREEFIAYQGSEWIKWKFWNFLHQPASSMRGVRKAAWNEKLVEHTSDWVSVSVSRYSRDDPISSSIQFGEIFLQRFLTCGARSSGGRHWWRCKRHTSKIGELKSNGGTQARWKRELSHCHRRINNFSCLWSV